LNHHPSRYDATPKITTSKNEEIQSTITQFMDGSVLAFVGGGGFVGFVAIVLLRTH
jgi:hypothetical protein